MNNFYIRLSKLSENKGFKSINKFALDGLNYSASEKLNRLKKENTNPSVEILLDISNKFEDANIDWLLTGKGEMLCNSENLQNNNELQKENEVLKQENSELKSKLVACQEEIIILLRGDSKSKAS